MSLHEGKEALKCFVNTCVGTGILCSVIEYFDRKYKWTKM